MQRRSTAYSPRIGPNVSLTVITSSGANDRLRRLGVCNMTHLLERCRHLGLSKSKTRRAQTDLRSDSEPLVYVTRQKVYYQQARHPYRTLTPLNNLEFRNTHPPTNAAVLTAPIIINVRSLTELSSCTRPIFSTPFSPLTHSFPLPSTS